MLIARAPLRIGLAGAGTDLPAYYERYGGLVVSATIDKHVYVIVSATGNPRGISGRKSARSAVSAFMFGGN